MYIIFQGNLTYDSYHPDRLLAGTTVHNGMPTVIFKVKKTMEQCKLKMIGTFKLRSMIRGFVFIDFSCKGDYDTVIGFKLVIV